MNPAWYPILASLFVMGAAIAAFIAFFVVAVVVASIVDARPFWLLDWLSTAAMYCLAIATYPIGLWILGIGVSSGAVVAVVLNA